MKKGLMKVVALAAASVMAVAALAGCGSSDKLIMGTNAAFPPFEYTTSQGLEANLTVLTLLLQIRLPKM